MRRRREPSDDDELDAPLGEDREEALEVGHGASVFTREFRTASANRRAATIFRTRSVGVSRRFSRSNVRSTSLLYASIAGEGSRDTVRNAGSRASTSGV